MADTSFIKDIGSVRFWCYKVLPLVYDNSLSYYELLCKVTDKLNTLIENNNNIPELIKEMIKEGVYFDALLEEIAKANDGESKTATVDRTTGELIWLNNELYRITRDMLAGDQYVVSSTGVTGNIEKITVEEWVKDLIEAEALERDNADKLIEDKITAEQTARTEAIQAEAEAREAADNALNRSITNEVREREQAESTLKSSIDAEIKARKALIDENGNYTQIKGTAQYGTPKELDENFNYVGAVDADGNEYKILTYKDKLVIKQMYVDVTEYGADNTGSSDSSQAVQEAIDACPYHATIYFPTGTYLFETPVSINKPLTIEGNYTGYDVEEIPTDTWREGQIKSTGASAFYVDAVGVHMRNIGIVVEGTGNGITIRDTSLKVQVPRKLSFDHMWVSKIGTSGCGFCTENCDLIVSDFTQCQVYGFANGFSIGMLGGKNSTSIKFDSCWAMNSNGVGFSLLNSTYCTFINCAADSLTGVIGYDIESSKGITVIGCGVEKQSQTGLRLLNSDNCIVNVTVVDSTSADYASIVNWGSNNNTFIGCKDYYSSKSGVGAGLITSIGSSTNINVIGCTYEKLKLLNVEYTNNANILAGFTAST